MSVEPGSDLTPPGYGQMRAAHADRGRAIDVLKAAFAEGRLDKDEYAGRVGQVYTSRSYAELAELTADLPAGPLGTLMPESGSRPVPAAATTSSPGTSALAVASLIFGIATVVFPAMFLAGVPAVLLGLVALARTGRTRRRGRWMAIVGIGLGVFGYMGGIGYFVLPYFGT
jgi:hypothetical protein